jgi:hypothetical protein
MEGVVDVRDHGERYQPSSLPGPFV